MAPCHRCVDWKRQFRVHDGLACLRYPDLSANHLGGGVGEADNSSSSPLGYTSAFRSGPMHKLILGSVFVLGVVAQAGCAVQSSAPPVSRAFGEDCDVPLWRSKVILRVLLENLTETYTAVGGRGIDRIEEMPANTFLFVLPHRERTDVVRYVVDVDSDCNVRILDRSVGNLPTKE